MRYLPLVLLVLLSIGCKKNSENGKVVELFVDHYATADTQMIFNLPAKTPVDTYLEGFDERELGYTYKVSAEIYIPDVAPMDGPSRWYKFVKVLNKEIYSGNEPFNISLKSNRLFSTGLALRFDKQTFFYGSYVLRADNDLVKKQLEEVLALAPKFQSDPQYAAKVLIDATVVHDPNNRSNGYLVKAVKIQ